MMPLWVYVRTAPACVLLSAAQTHLNRQKDLVGGSQCYFHWIQPKSSRGQPRQPGKVYLTSGFFFFFPCLSFCLSKWSFWLLVKWLSRYSALFLFQMCMYGIDRQAHQLWKQMHDTKALGCFCQGNASCAWDGGERPVPTPFSLTGTEHAETVIHNQHHHQSSLCLIRCECAYVCVYSICKYSCLVTKG